MPFNVTVAARFTREITIKFNRETLHVTYNAGEKYREYEEKSVQLTEELDDLNERISQLRSLSDAQNDAARAELREAYAELQRAKKHTRRRFADNVCTVIESWDLEGDLEDLKKRMAEKDRKNYKDLTGHGAIPPDGAFLDALPLPDKFMLDIGEAIGKNFESGGGKAA